MPARVRVVLSDLDDTLFDHSETTRVALAQVREAVPELSEASLDDLFERHTVLLDRLHLDVLAGRTSIDDARAERFRLLIAGGGQDVSRRRALEVARIYRDAYQDAWQPVPGALALARAIRDARVPLVIVTNNVVAEQRLKLDRTGLAPFVDHLVTSEEAGMTKPDPRIFDLALSRVAASPQDAVMIGDAWATDIEGARAAGVRAVWLNRTGAAPPDDQTCEMRSLEPTSVVLAVLGVQSRV